MYSIFHFFDSLLHNREKFYKVKKLENFIYDEKLLSCKNSGIFPDMAIRLNAYPQELTGGELIELKDSGSYTVSSFNSTIPSSKKKISRIIQGEKSVIKEQMEKVGDDIYSLPIRDVYYLVRGKKNKTIKVCLVHGSFFETTPIENLISQSFAQVLDERLLHSDIQLSDETRKSLLSIFSQQENFSKVRNVDNASVKLRFRIMTEVKKEGNILNPKLYPEIKDNSINLILPCYTETEREDSIRKVKNSTKPTNYKLLRSFLIKHPLNGPFLVFQTDLK
ncbi:MAG: hypothetical protein QME58_02505 [Bacteroidota bacterium]|nr:hypothetical protein [Bacteroidota bacterium]